MLGPHAPLDGDPVVELEAERLRGVVHYARLREVAAEHLQVLEVVALDEHARVAEDAVLDPPSLRVDDREQLVGVHLLRRREDDDLEELRTESRRATRRPRGVHW